MPKVSVVIPAYNAMTYLPETLECVLRQTFADFEVLIIDDGSSDHIVQWVSQVTDLRVKLISQENQGLPGARNTGIAHARGEYIAFVDADDLWEATKLEKQVQRFETDPAVGLVYTWTRLIDPLTKPTGNVFEGSLEGKIWEQIVVGDVVGSGSCAMVRRVCFETAGVFDRNLTSVEDWDMWIRIAARYPFAAVKEHLTLYRQHPSSMSKNRQRMLQNLRTVIEKAFESAPIELLYLRNRTYGHMNRCQAWISIYAGDYDQAAHFSRQALLHNPRLRYSKNFLHLKLAIVLMRWFGSDGYARLNNLSRRLRDRISSATS